MIITLCASSDFFDKLVPIKEALEKKGYDVLTPSMKEFEEDDVTAKQKYGLIKNHFDKISISKAIYVANYDKKGIKGYVGPNTFLEIGKAYDCGVLIFLLNEVPEQDNKGEIIAMNPIVVRQNWNRLDRLLKGPSKSEIVHTLVDELRHHKQSKDH